MFTVHVHTQRNMFAFYLSHIHHQEIHEFDVEPKFYRLSATHAHRSVVLHL